MTQKMQNNVIIELNKLKEVHKLITYTVGKNSVTVTAIGFSYHSSVLDKLFWMEGLKSKAISLYPWIIKFY